MNWQLARQTASFLAGVATVIGIVFAAVQLRFAVEVDKRQTTATILKSTRDTPLLQAFRRLELIRGSGRPAIVSLTEQIITDRDLILNTYDSLAIYYSAKAVDECLVKLHTRAALDVVISILEYLREPPESFGRILRLSESLDETSCSHVA